MDRYLCSVKAAWVSIFLFVNSTKVECFYNENFLYMSDCLLCPMPMTYDMMSSVQEVVQVSWSSSSTSLNKNHSEGYFGLSNLQLPSSGVYESLKIECPAAIVNSRITYNANSDLYYEILWYIMIGDDKYSLQSETKQYPLKNGTTYVDFEVEAFNVQITDLTSFSSSASVGIYASVHGVFMNSLNYNWYVNSGGNAQVKLTWYR